MAWNQQNYFPATYQPIYPQFQPQMPQQMMTPPTIRAEIVQVDNEDQAAAYPVAAGASQMMIARDDSAIFVKTANANGATLEVFIKRPPAPKEPEPVYMTRADVEAMIAAALPKRPVKKEAAE